MTALGEIGWIFTNLWYNKYVGTPLPTYTWRCMMLNKICSKCKQSKPYSKFSKYSRNKSTGLKSCCKDCDKLWKQLNKKEISEQGKVYYLNNKESIITKSKTYASKHKEQVKAYKLKYAKTERGRLAGVNGCNTRRTLRVSRSDGTLPQYIKYPLISQLHELLISQKYKCLYCNCEISHILNNIHLDHIHPLTKGGTHSINNVQWLCATCNMKKGDRI